MITKSHCFTPAKKFVNRRQTEWSCGWYHHTVLLAPPIFFPLLICLQQITSA